MKKIIMCDPPDGSKYGFPKPQPEIFSEEHTFHKWLIDEGYPEHLIKQMGEYFWCRVWEQEVDDEDEV